MSVHQVAISHPFMKGLVVSFLGHSALWLYLSHTTMLSANPQVVQTITAQSINVTLARPPLMPQAGSLSTPKPVPQPTQQVLPSPKLEQPHKKPIAQKPQPKQPQKTSRNKPKKTTVTSSPPSNSKLTSMAEPSKPVATAQVTHTTTQQPTSPRATQHESEQYLSNLISQINRYKKYPRPAVRRNIEGSVTFRLKLNPDGSFKDMEWISGQNIFKSATLKAIQSSLPIRQLATTPPTSVVLTIDYRLI